MTGIRNQRGFSLIEALIAMVLLSIGLLGAGLLQIGSIKANVNAAERTLGVGLAQSTMDRLRCLSQGDALLTDTGDRGGGLDDGRAPAGGVPNPAAADVSLGSITASDGRVYTVFWNIADDVPVAGKEDEDGTTLVDGTKTVRLFVYWRDDRFGLNKVVITTVLGGKYLL